MRVFCPERDVRKIQCDFPDALASFRSTYLLCVISTEAIVLLKRSGLGGAPWVGLPFCPLPFLPAEQMWQRLKGRQTAVHLVHRQGEKSLGSQQHRGLVLAQTSMFQKRRKLSLSPLI